MIRSVILALGLLVLSPLAAAATPATISVEPWKQVDGNFAFSVIHGASGGHMQRDGLHFYAGGSIDYEFSNPTQFLSGDLTGDVLTLGAGSLALNGGSIFNVQTSVLDFGVASGGLIGAIDYELVAGGSTEVGSFYFYNFDYTNGSCDANGLCADGDYRLWGNNWDAAGGVLRSQVAGNVTVDGVVATRHRGIDLGGNVSAPVPEPSAALLFGLGSLVASSGMRRKQ